MHKHLHEVMGWRGPVTHRQFAAWMLWLDEQWDHPTKLEWHILQLTAEVCRTTLKPEHRGKIKTSDFKIPFKPPAAPHKPPSSPEMTRRQKKVMTQIAKTAWLGVVGNVEVK